MGLSEEQVEEIKRTINAVEWDLQYIQNEEIKQTKKSRIAVLRDMLADMPELETLP